MEEYLFWNLNFLKVWVEILPPNVHLTIKEATENSPSTVPNLSHQSGGAGVGGGLIGKVYSNGRKPSREKEFQSHSKSIWKQLDEEK